MPFSNVGNPKEQAVDLPKFQKQKPNNRAFIVHAKERKGGSVVELKSKKFSKPVGSFHLCHMGSHPESSTFT